MQINKSYIPDIYQINLEFRTEADKCKYFQIILLKSS